MSGHRARYCPTCGDPAAMAHMVRALTAPDDLIRCNGCGLSYYGRQALSVRTDDHQADLRLPLSRLLIARRELRARRAGRPSSG